MTTPAPASATPSGPVSFFSAGTLIVQRISRVHRASANKIGIEFHYDPADPAAIVLLLHVHFRGQDIHPAWRFAREMLDHGRVGPVGEGDVRLAPKARWVEFTLRTPGLDRELLLSVELVDVEAALATSEALVPLTAPDPVPDPDAVDAELAAILAGGEPR